MCVTMVCLLTRLMPWPAGTLDRIAVMLRPRSESKGGNGARADKSHNRIWKDKYNPK